MNSNSNSDASALLGEAFGGGFSKFESLSNDLESELTIEEKRLRGMPTTNSIESVDEEGQINLPVSKADVDFPESNWLELIHSGRA